MRVLDLSKPLDSAIEIYSDGSYRDPPFEVSEWCSVESQGYRVSAVRLGTQTGTHIDAPAHFDPQGLGAAAGSYREWSGVALGSHVVPWIVLQLFRPQTALVGVVAAAGYALVWWWVRGEIKAQFSTEIASKERATLEAAEASKKVEAAE